MVDLPLYFARIGYQGEIKPTVANLHELIRRHALGIPFENLTSLSGETVPLDIAALEQKLLRSRRGGYCFEHNTLLWRVLEQLGFHVTGLAARVVWSATAQPVRTPRGHMLLKVLAEGEDYLIDVGFGGLTLTAPLRFVHELEQATPHEVFRMRDSDGAGRESVLEAQLGGVWKPLYIFDDRTQDISDYEVWNWYTCSHPKSPFVNTLMLGRPEAGGRHALLNNRYTHYREGRQVESRVIGQLDDLLRVIEQAFDIEVPRSPALHSKLSALLSP